MEMNQTMEEKNKALVLKAFDALFNKRDYAAAERYWSPTYIQHSAHIAPGREGLFNLIKKAKAKGDSVAYPGNSLLAAGRLPAGSLTTQIPGNRRGGNRGPCLFLTGVLF